MSSGRMVGILLLVVPLVACVSDVRGGDGQPCFENGECDPGFACRTVDEVETCVVAGGAGQPCEPGKKCAAGLECQSVTGGSICRAAGGNGQPCRNDLSCDAGLRCDTAADEAVCTDRGGEGQTCIAGGKCVSPLTCLQNVCQRCDRAEWVRIPGGTFQMGSPDTPESSPVHAVTVSSFDLSRTEVTVCQFRACVEDGSCDDEGMMDVFEDNVVVPEPSEHCNWRYTNREAHPINCIPWQQARKVCAYLGGRLPTEAEWEYAARGGDSDRPFPWGAEAATCDRAVMNDGGKGCGQDGTLPVCSRPKGNSPQGVCDLAGNVFEWLEDSWHETYDGAPDDGVAWVVSSEVKRVVRGGSWGTDTQQWMGNRIRTWSGWARRGNAVGARCAR